MNLDEHIQHIESQKSHPIIFVCGMGGSGKTTFAKKLVAENANAIHFEADWYLIHSSKERALRIKQAMDSGNQTLMDQELDPINHCDWAAFKRDIQDLQLTGKSTVTNAWNQQTGEKDGTHKLDFQGKGGLIVCDGDDILHQGVVELADLVIFLDVSMEEARRRADARDAHRSSPDHLARKKFITEKYDVPYFNIYRKNADLILK